MSAFFMVVILNLKKKKKKKKKTRQLLYHQVPLPNFYLRYPSHQEIMG